MRECEQQLRAIGTRATAATARDAEKTAAGNHATAAAAGAAVAGVGDSRGGNACAGGGSSECINEELTVSRLRRGAGGDLVGGARAAAKLEVVLQAEQERLFATDGSVVSLREVVVLEQTLASDDRPATGCRRRLQRRRCCQCCWRRCRCCC